MTGTRKPVRTVWIAAMMTVIAAAALTYTAVGVGAERLSFLDSLQPYLNTATGDEPVDVPGNGTRSLAVMTGETTPVCTLIKGTELIERASSPSVSCPQTVLFNDNSTSGNARAPTTRFAGSRAVYLITAAELAAVGYASGQSVESIGWNMQTGTGASGSGPLKVYLQNTSDTGYAKGTSFGAAITGMTNVHNATTLLPGTAGTYDVVFSGGSPFTYTGGGLYVAFDWGPYAGTLGLSQVIWCNSLGLSGGLAGTNNQNDGLLISSFRPETRLSSGLQNDAAVSAVYSYGEVPRGRVPAQMFKAVITNVGALAKTNIPVTLNVTGANTFTDTQMIASLANCGTSTIVTFASFTPVYAGTNTITVSIPSDDVNGNNSMSKAFNVTPNRYSYKIPGSANAGGVGLTGGTGAFVAKFTTSVATTIQDVNLDFQSASATTYRVAIYGDSGTNTPSTTALYVDASDRTVTSAGPITITLPSPVAVGPGNFYVGIQQTNTTNAGLGFGTETPIRSGSFFFATALPPTTWVDESPGNDFKLNIGVNLQAKSKADFDGDGKTDAALFRRSGGMGTWYILRSTLGFLGVAWGSDIDTFLTGDWDGDGKADFGLWRPNATPGIPDFHILNSNGLTYTGFPWGLPGDVPVLGDVDGDGKDDFVVFRASDTNWYIYYTSTNTFAVFQFGLAGDVPVMMDANGDGKLDLGVFRPSDGFWYTAAATGIPSKTFAAMPFGLSSDIKVPADYDGDGRDDIAVFRPSIGTWYIVLSSTGQITFTQFGMSGDYAVPGDYDGDGKADIAVYRNGVWYILGSRAGYFTIIFGAAAPGDTPVPATFHSQNGPPVG